MLVLFPEELLLLLLLLFESEEEDEEGEVSTGLLDWLLMMTERKMD